MIRRVFKGKSPYGLIKYLYGEGRRNEHTDAHLIGSWDDNPAGLEPELVDGLHDVAPLVRQLEQPVRACGRAPEKWVYHLVLRNDPGDRRLSDREWNDVCAAAMDATGIAPAGDPAGCRWVAVRHADDHVHLVATLAREDGRVPRAWNDYTRLAHVAHEFEDRYGLRSTAGRDDHTAAPRPGVKEQITYERARRRSPRALLRGKVKAAAALSAGFGEFTDRLAAQGVTVWPRMSERTPDQITGYSVSLNDWVNAAGAPVRFGGGKLAPDLSLPKLLARWEPASTGRTPAEERQPFRGTGRQERGPLTGADAERVWAEAERIVRDAAEKITTGAASDPSSAADAAWAAGDTLAAAAAGVEGDTGGALTDAADAFDRAGREAERRIPARSDTGTALRTAGRIIGLLAPGARHPAAQVAALTTQLAALTIAVADLRAAQRRLHQADAARTSAQHLRSIVPAPPLRSPHASTAAHTADLSAGGGQFRPSRSSPKKSNGGTPDRPDSSRRRPLRPGQNDGRGPSR